jgi:hypothetical protein
MVLSCKNDIQIDTGTIIINTFANNSRILEKILLYHFHLFLVFESDLVVGGFH